VKEEKNMKNEVKNEVVDIRIQGYLAAVGCPLIEASPDGEDLKVRGPHGGYIFLGAGEVWRFIQECSYECNFEFLPDLMMPKGARPLHIAGLFRN